MDLERRKAPEPVQPEPEAPDTADPLPSDEAPEQKPAGSGAEPSSDGPKAR
jgi:hypothetical protein